MSTERGEPSATRRKGRPQKNSGPDARATLIEATRALLKTQPPAQINRLEIARLAGVDPALVRYYFGDKDELLRLTAVQMMGELRQRRRLVQRDRTSFRGKLRAHLRFLIEVLHDYPFLHDLLLGQIARAGTTQASELRRGFIEDPFCELRGMLDTAAARGEIRPLNAAFFYVAMIGMCSFPMRNRMLLEQVMETGSLTPEVAAEYAAFVADLLQHGLDATKGRARVRGSEPT